MGKKSQTTTPTNPAWVTSGIQGLMGNISNLSGQDPQSFVAKWNPYQQEGLDRATQLGQSNPWLDRATSMIDLTSNAATPHVDAQSLLTNLQNYMSPYTKDVVDTSLADYDFGAGKTRAQGQLDLAKSGAFGGSGSAITQSMTNDALTRGRGTLSAGLRDQAFNTGAGLSSQDAQMRQQAEIANANAAGQKQALNAQLAALMGQLGFSQGDAARADASTILDAGNTKYGADTTTAQAPLSLVSQLSQATGALPLNLFNGQKTTTSGGGLGSLVSLAGMLASPLTGGLSAIPGLTGAASKVAAGSKALSSYKY